jgi:hypothetical protein
MRVSLPLLLLASLLAAAPGVAEEDDRVADPAAPAESETDSETESESETDSETETESETDSETETESESESESESDSETESESEADSETESESESDSETESESESDSETESESESDSETESESESKSSSLDPATATQRAAEELPHLQLEPCRERMARGDVTGARVCYETAPGAESQATGRRVADALARVEGLKRERGPSAGERIGDYVLGGKAELVATSGAYGAYLGVLGDGVGAGLIQSLRLTGMPQQVGITLAGTAVLVPLATGGAALAGVGLGTWFAQDMTAGQANLVRASMWLAAFDATMGTFIINDYGQRLVLGWWEHQLLANFGSMFALNLAVTGSAIAAAALLPEDWLPASAGSLGLSAAAYGGTLTVLGLAMNRFRLGGLESMQLFTLVPNLSFLTGVALAPLLPMSRYETWLMDGGAVVGALLATALVIGVPAGNPVVGYGGIATGLVLGAGSAVAVGKLIPLGLDAMPLPDLVAVAPLVIPPGARTPPAFGVQLGVDLGQVVSRW